ncbi:MAG TPA: sulfate adenylyltransferase subunit CysN [Candidatus Acidoferrum sp.]|nr:sulfate adenylyltransferase subunit CysN [Candidatus Acidoferrum sp.]
MAASPSIAVKEGVEQFLDQELGKQLLRFTTAGSVDDGKSTLIGRLLHDCKAVYEDQLASVKKSPVNRSGKAIDFSLLTDGLRAEREQGITIDVAYRYFSTPRRKFIIADTPGHEQYTRNMATGASTADLAVILVDATKGLLPQTKRHTFIASLLGIRHLLVAVNKMDLVGFGESVFLRLESDFLALAARLGNFSVQCIPLSALDGDNLVSSSAHTPWYTGPTMLEHLETVEIQPAGEIESLRFPVQSVIRPDARFRGFAGRVASGTIRPGDEVLALPSNQKTRIESIVGFDGELPSAGASDSIVLTLSDEIDLSRGDMLVSPNDLPRVSNRFTAMVVWLHEAPLELHRNYLAKHAGRVVKARARHIHHRVDVNTLHENAAARLAINEIGLVEFETSLPLFFDSYANNRTTGSLILIDPLSNATVGALMIRSDRGDATQSSVGIGRVASDERAARRGQRSAIVVVRSSQAEAEKIERALWEQGLDAISIPARQVFCAKQLFERLWDLGLVFVIWGESGAGETNRKFSADFAGDSYFELDASGPLASPEDFFDAALQIAKRVKRNGTTLGKGAL